MSGTTAVLTPQEFALAFGLLPETGAPAPTPPVAAYTTGYNERWDMVAWRLYGDPTQVNSLIMANPGVPIACELPQATYLIAPLLPPPGPAPSSTPWGPQ
jgi:hypothetical protein